MVFLCYMTVILIVWRFGLKTSLWALGRCDLYLFTIISLFSDILKTKHWTKLNNTSISRFIYPKILCGWQRRTTERNTTFKCTPFSFIGTTVCGGIGIFVSCIRLGLWMIFFLFHYTRNTNSNTAVAENHQVIQEQFTQANKLYYFSNIYIRYHSKASLPLCLTFWRRQTFVKLRGKLGNPRPLMLPLGVLMRT